MKAAIDRIKAVLATKDFGTHLNHYLFEPGWVLASDGRMVACVPTTEQLSCLIPGPELEAVLDRFGEITEVSHDANTLKIKSGRLRGSIATLEPGMVEFLRPVHEWETPPPTLIEALRTARPFIAETAVQGWALTACLFNEYVTATNNISIVRIDCPNLKPPQEALLPAWAIDYLLKVDDELTGVIWNENYAAFRWKSGLWFRTQLTVGTFPTQIAALLAHPERATTRIEPEWQREYRAIADLSENSIALSPTEIAGGHGKAVVKAEIETPSITSTVLFNPKFLTPVIAASDYWAPEIYPVPVPFRGDGFSGIIVGRKA